MGSSSGGWHRPRRGSDALSGPDPVRPHPRIAKLCADTADKPRGLITMRWAVGFALLMALVFALTFGYRLGATFIDQLVAR